MPKYQALFFPNGNTAFFKNGEQVPEIQKHSWIIEQAKVILAANIDPTTVEYTMPNGNKARVFETPDGYNWEIL